MPKSPHLLRMKKGIHHTADPFSFSFVCLPRTLRHALLDRLARWRSGKTAERRFAELDRHTPPDLAHRVDDLIDGDTALNAGKGHENYQELSTGRIDFSDAKEVRRNMRIKDEFTQA